MRARPALRRLGSLTVVAAVALAPTTVAGAATSGWNQSGGGPGNTAAITAPGALSPATVTNLALDYSVPTGQLVTQSPALVDGVLYAGTFGGRLLAIDAADGHTRWSRGLCDGKRPAYNGAEETTPAVGSGGLFVLGDGGVLTGIRAATPHTVFACIPVPGVANGNGWSPTVSGGVVYARSDTRVVAVDATTGAVIWQRPLPAGLSAASNVVVDGGSAFVGANTLSTGAGHVLAFDAATGHLRWSVTRQAFVQALAAKDGRVVTGGLTVQARAETTGATVWTSTVHGADAVTISGTRVLVAGTEASPVQGELLALDATTGARLWQTGIGSEEESQPSAGGGVSYLVDLDTGSLFMNRLTDGHLLAVVSHPGGYYDELATPVVVDGHIFLFTQTGTSSNLDRWSVAS